MIRKTNLRDLASWGVIILIFALLIGCAAKKPLWGNAKTGFILEYSMTPDQMWVYETTTQQNQTMEMMGQSMETETNIINNYTIKGAGLDDQKNILSQVTINKMSMSSKGGMQGDNNFDMSPFIGKSFGLTFSPKGEELEFPGADSLEINLGQMGGGKRSVKNFFRNPLPDLPENPLKIGGTWTSKRERTEPQSGIEVTTITESTHTLEGFETINNTECLRIKTGTKGTLDGSGEQMGADMTFEGDIESTSTWYVAYKKGFFVQSTTDYLLEGTIAVAGTTNMTIPITQESKTEIQLVR